MSSRRFLAACLAAAVLGAGALSAQRAGQETAQRTDPKSDQKQDGEFFDVVNVNVVNVDVYVTDKKGNRINDLTRDDFEIFEDGRPVAITNFYAVREGRAVAPKPEPAPQVAGTPVVPQPPVQDLNDVQTPEDQRLRLVVYIDNFNIRPFNRNRVSSLFVSRLNPVHKKGCRK